MIQRTIPIICLSLQKFETMKRLIPFLFAWMLILMASCENPNRSRAFMDEGSKQLLRYSNFEEAEKLLTKAIRYDKHNYEAYYYRGCTRINAKQYSDAIADLEKAVELKPDYADAYFNLGKTYYLMNNEDKACEYYKLADQYGRPNLEDYLKRCN